MLASDAAMLAWVRGTPLGREVVPEVCRKRAVSVGRGGSGGPASAPYPAGGGSGRSDPATGASAVVKPVAWAQVRDRAATGTPCAAAAARAAGAAASPAGTRSNALPASPK